MSKPTARLRALRILEKAAATCGRLDSAGELGSLGTAFLSSLRRQALDLGCLRLDVDDACLDGLDLGRGEAS